MATDSLQDVNHLIITNEILPGQFRGKQFEPKEIILPLEAKNWIIKEKNRIKQLVLVDNFFVLLVLGALGSLIFLISEHIKDEKNNDIKMYYFRPIFGMLLAVATFIVSMSFNSLTSTITIDNVRFESLLFLAFSAGLLSDKTYEMIVSRANNNINAGNEDEQESADQKSTVSKSPENSPPD